MSNFYRIQKDLKSLQKYFQQYAEPEAGALDNFPNRSFQHGLIVPIYREEPCVFDRFTEFSESHSGTLLIFIVNRPDTTNHLAEKNWSAAFLNRQQKKLWSSDTQPITLYPLKNNSAALIIDRCIDGDPIPSDQGVGLARKIGADCLGQLIYQGVVSSPWIANTDADALLPDDYFQAIQNIPADTAAIIYPFEHVFLANLDKTNKLATLLYELSLHYYVAGLTWAGSPYAYHTIGSTIAVHYQHYAKVRGFPKRSGAEDFYLLNKLAKTGTTLSIESPTIQLIARTSDRVPFGTGPAVKKIIELKQAKSYPLYHPDSFCYLMIFLSCLDNAAKMNSLPEINHIINTAISEYNSLYNALDAQALTKAANTLNTQEALMHSFQQGKSYSVRKQHLQHWFDSFKTLKFIHRMRDNFLGTITTENYIKNLADKNIHPTFFANKKMHQLIKRINAAE